VLLAAGAGMAALGGLDHITFSGRFARAGERVGPWLVDRLAAGRRRGAPLTWSCLAVTLERLVADHTVAVLAEEAQGDPEVERLAV